MNELGVEDKRQSLLEQTERLVELVEQAYEQRQPLHELERSLFQGLLALGQQVLGLFFQLCGTADRGLELELTDGRRVKRLEPLHRRAYQSIFGPFELERAVYGSREGQTLEYVPLDAQLQLPASKFSYLLQEWDQALAVEQPFAQVSETVARILGFEQSVHSLERVNRQLSSSVEAFWDARAAAPAAQGEEIIVCSADGKGVVMRGELTETAPARAAPEAVLATPSKAGGKKMALIGAVYTIAPSVRTPSPVLTALFDPPTLPSPERPLRPKPLHKYVRASLERDGQDTMAPSYGCVFDWLEQEQRQRNPDGQRSVVVLLDGQDALWRAAERTFAGVEVVEILDLMHALEYLWDAAERLHPSAPKAVR
jgi:hypothetical protein